MLEYDAITSDFVVAPTLTADEMQAGALSALVNPLLPAAMAVAMLTDRRLSMIDLVGYPSQGTVFGELSPRLRLAEDRFRIPLRA